MKRTPLKRYTPIKPKAWTPSETTRKRNTRMRTMSKKTAKVNREVGPARRAFLIEMGTCCLCPTRCTCVHELFGGAVRQTTLKDRRAWLACCWDCHLGTLQDMPKEDQLRIKKRVDPVYFDLDWINELVSNGRGGKRFSV